MFFRKRKERRSTPLPEPLRNTVPEKNNIPSKPIENNSPTPNSSIGDLKTIKYVPPEPSSEQLKRERSYSLGTKVEVTIGKNRENNDKVNIQLAMQYRQFLEYQKMQMLSIFSALHSHNIPFNPNQTLQSIFAEIQAANNNLHHNNNNNTNNNSTNNSNITS